MQTMLVTVLRAPVGAGVVVSVRGVVCAEEQSRSKSSIEAQPNTSQPVPGEPPAPA